MVNGNLCHLLQLNNFKHGQKHVVSAKQSKCPVFGIKKLISSGFDVKMIDNLVPKMSCSRDDAVMK